MPIPVGVNHENSFHCQPKATATATTTASESAAKETTTTQIVIIEENGIFTTK